MFPNSFKIKTINKAAKTSISNIVIRVRLFANRKNDYYMIPDKSDEEGVIEFSKEWLIEKINKERNLFIMDYSSSIDDCKPIIEIKVISHNEIEELINGMELYKNYYGYTDSDIDKIKKAENFKYKPLDILINFDSEQSIEKIIELEKIIDKV